VEFTTTIELVVRTIELVAVGILAVGVAAMLALALYRTARRTAWPVVYRSTREGLGRVLLLGLEVLIAADIINTVALELTLTNAAALGLIVLIRTFLSWAIEVETDGRWPWQGATRDRPPDDPAEGSPGASRSTQPG
jgi:uncharacterized membrane protein